MRSLGIAIKKNEIWYSVVEGTQKETAIILETGKQNYILREIVLTNLLYYCALIFN